MIWLVVADRGGWSMPRKLWRAGWLCFDRHQM